MNKKRDIFVSYVVLLDLRRVIKGKTNTQKIVYFSICRGGATGWAGWPFAHLVFPGMKRTSMYEISLISYSLHMLLRIFEVLPTQFLQDCTATDMNCSFSTIVTPPLNFFILFAIRLCRIHYSVNYKSLYASNMEIKLTRWGGVYPILIQIS